MESVYQLFILSLYEGVRAKNLSEGIFPLYKLFVKAPYNLPLLVPLLDASLLLPFILAEARGVV